MLGLTCLLAQGEGGYLFPLQVWLFFESAFEKSLRRRHALTIRFAAASLAPALCGYGVCFTTALSGVLLCGAVGCEAMVCFAPPPPPKVWNPPPPPHGVQWDLACWLLDCWFFWLLGWWLVLLVCGLLSFVGSLAGWLAGWLVGWLAC